MSYLDMMRAQRAGPQTGYLGGARTAEEEEAIRQQMADEQYLANHPQGAASARPAAATSRETLQSQMLGEMDNADPMQGKQKYTSTVERIRGPFKSGLEVDDIRLKRTPENDQAIQGQAQRKQQLMDSMLHSSDNSSGATIRAASEREKEQLRFRREAALKSYANALEQADELTGTERTRALRIAQNQLDAAVGGEPPGQQVQEPSQKTLMIHEGDIALYTKAGWPRDAAIAKVKEKYAAKGIAVR